ncbi:MAG: restriction endonuclease subunit S, partial [bacterium]|nr:restriction endonuclease subunit S [bacterium]
MWREEPLGNLCIPRKGRNTDLADGVKDGYLPYLGAGQIAGDPIDKYASVEGGVICKDEDVLILWDGERSGLVGFGQAGVVSSTAAKLVVNERIDSQY